MRISWFHPRRSHSCKMSLELVYKIGRFCAFQMEVQFLGWLWVRNTAIFHFSVNIITTRMHSSRMRTVHCSGRLSCHACPLPHTHPAMHTPPLCMPPATHTPLPRRSPSPPHYHHTCPYHAHPPPWTEFLTHIIVADGKYLTTADLDIGVFYSKLEYHRYANQLYS